MSGGILLVSIMSFHTILLVQSALVVGNKRILLILYNPSPNQARLKARKMSFGTCKSSPRGPNTADMPRMAVIGLMTAELVMLMEKILSCEPDMYIMNAFILCIAIIRYAGISESWNV